MARSGVLLNATRTDLSRRIVALEEELASFKRAKPVPEAPPITLTAAEEIPVAPVAAAAPALSQPEISTPAPAPSPPPSPSPAPPPRPPSPDDLKEIAGIGPILEHTLQSLGLKSFAQIARITPEDVAMLIVKVDSSIAERVLRERWVEQARDLHVKKYGRAP
jgi:predicted flap endonuclease-1-like 5' DNA nuclease